MKSKNFQELCERLLHTIDEMEVIDILKEYSFWQDHSVWSPYGNISNNRGIVGSQQSDPVAALIEKLINSVDAILISESWRKDIDPRGSSAPKSMQEAVEKFFSIPSGKLETLDPGDRTRLAEKIRLVAYGKKDSPCYLIIDDGEGQSPERFPNTFLSLLRDNKAGVPFVQGKYNMGGTGVLQFSGRNSFQLIISKRQAHLRKSSSDNMWGFTIIRRMDPSPDQPFTSYVFLAPEGKIPSFEADNIRIIPGPYPDAFFKEFYQGSCIKLWNYKLPGKLKTLATLDLRYSLELHLQEPALPIRVQERRVGYSAHYYDTTMSGLIAVLADNKDKIEPGFDTGSNITIPNVGIIALRLVVMKEELETNKRYPAGVFFNVNGQLHSELGGDKITRRAKLDYLSDSLIVTIDCSNLPQRIREDLFMASRDRMRRIEERDSLEGAIIEYLSEHPGLRDLNARRRQERISQSTHDETVNVVQQLLKSDPTLASLFGKGKELKIPIGPLPEPVPFEGKKYPTYFRIYKEPATGLVKNCPRNRMCKITFETDAANDYFSRTNDPGHCDSFGIASLFSHHLWNGHATFTYSLPPQVNIGDNLGISVDISDSMHPISMQSSFKIIVTPEIDSKEPGPSSKPKGSQTTGIPNIVDVYQSDWIKYNFNEHSVIQLKYNEEDNLDLFINMDNLYLRNEIARRRKLDPEIIRFWFKWGITLLVVGMLYENENKTKIIDEDNNSNFDIIERACKGLAVTIIPVISQLNTKSLD